MEKRATLHRGGYLEALLNGCPIAILAINAQGIITFANKEACKLMEREMNEFVGESITIIYENLEAARETNRKLYQNGGVIHDHESKAKTKSGKVVPVRISAAHIKDSSGAYAGAVGYFEKYRPWTSAEKETKARAEELQARLEEWKDAGAPVIELYPGLMACVVTGRLDAGRFGHIGPSLLGSIKTEKNVKACLIDLSSAQVDDSVASPLIKTIRTLNLLGVQCILAGIQRSLAQTMEPLLPDIGSIKSFSTTHAALEAALKSVGYEINKKD